MRKLILVVGLATALAAPSLASAATRCEQHQADRKATGTIIGAIAGGLLGNAVSHGGGRTGGTIIGAAGGAVVGNQLARENNACPPGYDAYNDGQGAYRDPAGYYGSDADENDYYRHYGRHSDGYIRYQNDMATDARSYSHDSDAEYRDDQTWRNGRGEICHWRDRVSRDDDGDVRHQWVQDCHD